TVLPSGQILLPKAEVLDCGSDDELAGLIAVQQALIDLDSWGRLEKAAAAGLQTADERAVKIRLSLSGEPAYLINPDWPDAYEKEAVERAGADLIKAGFDPAAIVTEAEHRALLASDPDTVASFGIGDPIAVRRQFVTSSGRTLRRSAVSPFFAIRAGTSPAMGFAELMGKPVFKESADHFASVDWQSLAGLLDSETTLFRLRVDGQKIVERKTAMFEVTGADPATVLAELKHALSDAKFRLWRLQKGGQSV
ncbi:MAG TPA: hypothetical protein VMI31_08475, partial [Fimbriimonadaceae bacterium]|nr:hypothetical protein [Fimbriimonadaceae bacterium]